MAQKRKMSFVVKGAHDDLFPLDMLRRDGCYPATTFGVDNMMVACSAKWEMNKETGKVELSLSRQDFKDRGFSIEMVNDLGPNIPRWESFGWKVEQVKKL